MNPNDPAHRIVVGIDGSPCAAHAAAWAADLAARRGTSLHLVHALNLTGAPSLLTRMSFDEYRMRRTKDGEELLDAARAEILARLPRLWITTEVAEAGATETLVSLSYDAALVVAGTRGGGGFAGLRLGSVSLRLAAHAHGPAVFVPERPGQPAADRGGEVVLGLTAYEPPKVIDFAYDLAAELGASLKAVHAWQPIPPYNGYYYIDPTALKTAAETVLDDALKPVREDRDPSVRLSAAAVCSTPTVALMEASRGARLLVLGAHRHRGPLSVGVGPVLHALLTHAPCPVVVVPTAQHQGEQN
jgi:nucleotide-binding universal stress UspA family protein